ncbi:MAG: UDP-N-acetylmuramate dehydrogenase [Arcanobacterium sp.]|nr:UDP-N-acetylmuramate dehydrogenase [Arcanobacterium sp.]MDY5589316.1 UDP-N-acetylmuramate dehydrogenase [Arcanobacterium sp.]
MSCSVPEFHESVETIPPVQWTRWRAAEAAHSLADVTTFEVGGKLSHVVNATSEQELIAAVIEADTAGLPLLVVGGGSNILASSKNFEGIIVRDARQEITTVFEEGCPGARIHVTAGTPWDETVVYAVEHGWMGMEALSGIPGTTGAAIVQNIGAYGQEVAGTVAVARTFDRLTRSVRTIFMSDMKLGYRTSILKESMRRPDAEGKMWGPSPRWIVLDVDFQLRLATLSEPVRYGQLAEALGIEPGSRAPSSDVRAAVLELRRGKGMVLDDSDRDTYSAGSFFVNPVLTEAEVAASRLPDDAPRFAVTDATAVNQIGAAAPKVPGLVKTSAAWLIDHAGFSKGYGLPGPAALSSKHALALTNRGGASGEDIAALAREIQLGVWEKFGVQLEPEPVLVGF